MTKVSKIFRKFLKCIRCDKKVEYKNVKYVIRIPEQHKYAVVCEECYIRRKGNAQMVEEIRKSEHNGMKLEYDNMLKLP